MTAANPESLTSHSHLGPKLGLCCMFREVPIKFSTTTVTSIAKLKRKNALEKLSALCHKNALATFDALQFCHNHGIACFRVNSQILPIKTHPIHGYDIHELPESETIIAAFKKCGDFSRKHDLRTCFHPDQFVVLNSPREDVIEKSISELDYQAEVAEWIGADVLNIHAGGVYGDKLKALEAFANTVETRIPDRVRALLTIENDDISYTPADLLPLCQQLKIPLVYDVHHHRCNKDGLSINEATVAALATWENASAPRAPLFHISSPIEGWDGPRPERHHDFINVADFPTEWRHLNITVEVEAKAKEVAVHQLLLELNALT